MITYGSQMEYKRTNVEQYEYRTTTKALYLMNLNE